MKKIILLLFAIFILSFPATSFGWGLEVAGGAWHQEPSGQLSFDQTTKADDLDLEDNLNYDDKWKAFGRLIIDTPSFFPSIYLMYTPMKWNEPGSKDVDFNFGGLEFKADVDFKSELKLNHFDVGLFWGLPFIRNATSDAFNIDIGLNVRMMDVRAEIEQEDLDLKDSVSYLLPLPMLYTGFQIKPIKYVAAEFEGRGITWSSHYYVSVIGRLKIKPWGPIFVAGGYRYDKVKIDYDDLDLDVKFQGPFAEAGLAF